MLRTTNPQHSLWEAILPEPFLGLPAELAKVDALLDDPGFLVPLAGHFDPHLGRPSIPLDTYLRMMFLKFRYQLGYELRAARSPTRSAGSGSAASPGRPGAPPDHTGQAHTRRLGEQTVRALNEALLATAAEHKLLRTHRVRADTTVVAANVCYPTDAGLLGRAIGKLATAIGRIQAAGAARRTTTRDRRRSARRRAHQLAKTLRGRSEQAKQVVLRITGELADLAEQAVGDAARPSSRPDEPAAPARLPTPVQHHQPLEHHAGRAIRHSDRTGLLHGEVASNSSRLKPSISCVPPFARPG
jgi:transposase, IS5 family